MYSSRKANLMLLTFFDTAKLLLKITTTKNRASLWRKNLLTKWVARVKKAKPYIYALQTPYLRGVNTIFVRRKCKTNKLTINN